MERRIGAEELTVERNCPALREAVESGEVSCVRVFCG